MMNIEMTDTQKVEIFEKWEEKRAKLTINQKKIQEKINYFEDQVSKASLEPSNKLTEVTLDTLMKELYILASSFKKEKQDSYEFEKKFPELFSEE